MVRGCCLSLRGSKGMEWKYDHDSVCVCVCDKRNRDTCVFECKFYDMVRRRWMTTWDMLDEKESIMDVIKGYVEVNDDMQNEEMRYMEEVWTERQRKERNRVNVIP